MFTRLPEELVLLSVLKVSPPATSVGRVGSQTFLAILYEGTGVIVITDMILELARRGDMRCLDMQRHTDRDQDHE